MSATKWLIGIGVTIIAAGAVIYITKPFPFLKDMWLNSWAKKQGQSAAFTPILNKMSEDEKLTIYTYLHDYDTKYKKAPSNLQTKFDGISAKYNMGS